MVNNRIAIISIWMTVLATSFIAIYTLITNYFFTKELCGLLFYLFYLILFLNYLYYNKNEEALFSKIKWLSSNIKNLAINTIVIFLFAIIIIRSNASAFTAFIILLCGQCLFVATIAVLKRKFLFILFWINFYLFMGTLIFYQLPGISLDILSRINPYGALFIHIFL